MMQARGSSISNKVLNQALKFHLGCCCNFIFHHFRRRKFPDATAASSTRKCDGYAAAKSWHEQSWSQNNIYAATKRPDSNGTGPVCSRSAYATKSSSTTAGPNAAASADDGSATTWPDAAAAAWTQQLPSTVLTKKNEIEFHRGRLSF